MDYHLRAHFLSREGEILNIALENFWSNFISLCEHFNAYISLPIFVSQQINDIHSPEFKYTYHNKSYERGSTRNNLNVIKPTKEERPRHIMESADSGDHKARKIWQFIRFQFNWHRPHGNRWTTMRLSPAMLGVCGNTKIVDTQQRTLDVELESRTTARDGYSFTYLKCSEHTSFSGWKPSITKTSKQFRCKFSCIKRFCCNNDKKSL